MPTVCHKCGFVRLGGGNLGIWVLTLRARDGSHAGLPVLWQVVPIDDEYEALAHTNCGARA